MQRVRVLCVLLAASLHAGCKPSSFEPYEETASVRVHATPNNYELPSYGAQLVSLPAADSSGAALIYASAGAGSPISIARAWTGRGTSERGPQLRCREAGECAGGSDLGASLIPFETWGARSSTPQNNCVFAPSNSTLVWSQQEPLFGGEAFVFCENASNVHFAMSHALLAARGEAGSLQFSGFGLPRAHPLGVVMYGAYGLDNKTGERRLGGLYLQADFNVETSSAMLALPVPLIDPATKQLFADDPEAGDLGRQLVGSVSASGDVLFAVSQPSKQRVLIGSYEGSLPGAPSEKIRLRACVSSPDPALRGFGERLLLGDVTGDGVPELFVGVDPVAGVEPGKQALYMYRGAALPEPDPDACPQWPTLAVPVPCRDTAGLSCAGSAFGASLAIGDIDADKLGDLIVGAPGTSVDGAAEAGAVWLIPGMPMGLALERSAVVHTGEHAGAQLGASVAALRTAGRDEPVAGAPGDGEYYVFMCSPLEQDYGASSLCLSR